MKASKFNISNILLKIPVLWAFILTYMVGLILQFLLPIGQASRHVNIQAVRIAGSFVFVTGALFAAWSLIIFHEARTTSTPGESSKKLVMSGPYKFSRNPMFGSLTMVYLGEAGILAQLWPVIVLPLMLIYLNKVVIPLEESILTKDFGEDFLVYCSRVRRWV